MFNLPLPATDITDHLYVIHFDVLFVFLFLFCNLLYIKIHKGAVHL